VKDFYYALVSKIKNRHNYWLKALKNIKTEAAQ